MNPTTPSSDAREARLYRKKPVVIEAVQWTGANIEEVLLFFGDFSKLPNNDGYVNPGIGHCPSQGTLDIPTLEGTMTASPGDWIIKGVQGEFYPCKPDIFAMTYESASASPAGAEPVIGEFHIAAGHWPFELRVRVPLEVGLGRDHSFIRGYYEKSQALEALESCRPAKQVVSLPFGCTIVHENTVTEEFHDKKHSLSASILLGAQEANRRIAEALTIAQGGQHDSV